MKKDAMTKFGGVLIVILIGVALGYFLFQSNKNSDNVSELKSEEELTPEEIAELEQQLIEEREPEQATYEGSEAEQSVIREISEDEENKLKESAGEDAFVSKAYGYAFTPPAGWYEDDINSEISPFVTYTNYDPKDVKSVNNLPGVKLEVIVQGNTKKQTLDEWIEEGHGYMKVIKSEKVKIGNYDAYNEEVDFNGLMSVLTFIKGDDVYTVSLTGNDDSYKENKEVFNQVVESLEVI